MSKPKKIKKIIVEFDDGAQIPITEPPTIEVIEAYRKKIQPLMDLLNPDLNGENDE